MDDLARLQVRLDANTARFERGMTRAQRVFDRSARGIEGRARQLDQRVGNSFRRLNRVQGNAIQQAGFQVGDFAVQVASGQSALRAFIQQGTQFVQIFGPIGSIIGAAGAVVGALAVSLIGVGDAAEDAADETTTLADAMELLQGAGSRIDQLNAEIANSSGTLRSALIAERDATVDLLKARLELARSTLVQRNSDLDQQAAQIARDEATPGGIAPAVGVLLRGREQRQRDIDEFVKNRSPEIREELLTAEVKAELRGLEAQIARTVSGLETLSDPTRSAAEPAFSAPRRRSSGGGGGGGRASSSRAALGRGVEDVQARIDALNNERAALGLNEAERVRFNARVEAGNIVSELEAKARQDGIVLTDAQRAEIQSLAASYQVLTVSISDSQRAIAEKAEADREAKQAQEELGRSISQTTSRFASAIQQADSFKDAIKSIGLEILNLAVQGSFGQGPLGSILGGVFGAIGGSAGGGFAKGAAFSGGNVVPFASGGVISAPTTFPMSRGRVGLMGEAGPEAIVPLSRGADGKLGIRSSGSGQSIVVNTTIDARGADMGVEQRLKAALAERDRRLPAQIRDIGRRNK